MIVIVQGQTLILWYDIITNHSMYILLVPTAGSTQSEMILGGRCVHQMSVLINMCIPSCHDALANAVIRACELPSIIQICPRPLSVQSMYADDTLIGVSIDASYIKLDN